jgi:hypothetical protein
MAGTKFTRSYPLFITVDFSTLQFNGLVQAIQAARQRACGELLGILLRAAERRAQKLEPQRWENRGQQTRRLRLLWGGDPRAAHPGAGSAHRRDVPLGRSAGGGSGAGIDRSLKRT